MHLHSLSVEVIQTGFDVCVIVVDLVLIESCLGIERSQSLLQLNQFGFPPLPIAPLVSNVLPHEKKKMKKKKSHYITLQKKHYKYSQTKDIN